MRDVFDIYTIIFLALAVFIFLRLRSVLGQRTGRERPPYDPYSAREPARPATEKVVALPNRSADAAAKKSDLKSDLSKPEGKSDAPSEPPSAGERWKGVAAAGSTVASGLDAVAAVDPEFDAQHFLTGARAAYEMIVTAFADGERRILNNLLAREVYEGFEAAISERETKGNKVENRFVSIDSANITAVELRSKTAQVTVRFVSQLVSVTRDKDDNVVDGNPDAVTDVTDVWTFARDLSSRDPNWKLVATEAGQ
jgi:predicted lipid-binding transport protein (Tim44 family)